MRRAFSTAAGTRDPSVSWNSCVDDAGRRAAVPYRTHDVLNQVMPLEDHNAYSCDASLADSLHKHGGSWAEKHVSAFGACVGSAAWQARSCLANAHKPVLHTHNRHGVHVDFVEYHPAYHEIQRLAIETGVASFGWEHATEPGAMVARSALMYLLYQLEPGVECHVQTRAVPLLGQHPAGRRSPPSSNPHPSLHATHHWPCSPLSLACNLAV